MTCRFCTKTTHESFVREPSEFVRSRFMRLLSVSKSERCIGGKTKRPKDQSCWRGWQVIWTLKETLITNLFEISHISQISFVIYLSQANLKLLHNALLQSSLNEFKLKLFHQSRNKSHKNVSNWFMGVKVKLSCFSTIQTPKQSFDVVNKNVFLAETVFMIYQVGFLFHDINNKNLFSQLLIFMVAHSDKIHFESFTFFTSISFPLPNSPRQCFFFLDSSRQFRFIWFQSFWCPEKVLPTQQHQNKWWLWLSGDVK